ncbi:hypothetical protein AN641_09385 [Candidatus Epulonipiscioides gigas]|nr:hypothetical protein AN641_09385 [Epulopiscium sp. SCG-C07WGA-EpuloA2]
MKKWISFLLMTGLVISSTSIYANEKNVIEAQSVEVINAQKAIDYANLIIEQAKVTSVQYALMKDGEIILSNVVSNGKEEVPVTTDTMFPIASVSKMFATSAIMMLVDEGKVDLDEPVTTYIPEFTMADERYKDITIRMLLNHSSGLMGSTKNNVLLYNDNDTIAHDSLLETLKTQVLKADPGEYSTYCSDGFTMAEIVVERVSKLSFTEFIAQKICAPLGMQNTKTPQDKFERDRIIVTYTGQNPDNSIENNNLIGSAGIYSTAEDLCRFGEIFTYNGFLSPEAIGATVAPEYAKGLWHGEEDTFAQYGLGWDDVELYPFFEQDIKVVTKMGDFNPLHSNLIVIPEHDLVVAVNVRGGHGKHALMMGAQMLVDELAKENIEFGKYISDLEQPTFTKPIDADILKYEGVYVSNYDIYKIEITDSILLYTNLDKPNNPPSIYYHLGDGVFRNNFGFEIEFDEAENGETYIQSTKIQEIDGLVPLIGTFYQAQKIEPAPIDENVQKAWDDRVNKMYILISEKYSSRLYNSPMYKLPSYNLVDGYIRNLKIIDENTLMHQHQIPQDAGRDWNKYTISQENGVEYLTTNGYVYRTMHDIPNLDEKTYTINGNGYSQYYGIKEEQVGKVLSFSITTGNGAIMVYNEQGACIYNSWINDQKDITLPENGAVMFAGDMCTNFEITIK